jgi:hypothetical protein
MISAYGAAYTLHETGSRWTGLRCCGQIGDLVGRSGGGFLGGSAMRRVWVPLVLAVLAALLSPVSVSAQERDRDTARDSLLGEPAETVGAPDNSDFTLPGGGVAG